MPYDGIQYFWLVHNLIKTERIDGAKVIFKPVNGSNTRYNLKHFFFVGMHGVKQKHRTDTRQTKSGLFIWLFFFILYTESN